LVVMAVRSLSDRLVTAVARSLLHVGAVFSLNRAGAEI
jgi:hypothetical protein